MKLYNGRRAINGYVSPDDHELIAGVAESRTLTLSRFVSESTLLMARLLRSPQPVAPAEIAALLNRLGIPRVSPPPAPEREPEPPPRWQFERRAARAHAAGEKRTTKERAGKKRVAMKST